MSTVRPAGARCCAPVSRPRPDRWTGRCPLESSALQRGSTARLRTRGSPPLEAYSAAGPTAGDTRSRAAAGRRARAAARRRPGHRTGTGASQRGAAADRHDPAGRPAGADHLRQRCHPPGHGPGQHPARSGPHAARGHPCPAPGPRGPRQGCVFAGCSAPTWWCDAHHLLECVLDGAQRPGQLSPAQRTPLAPGSTTDSEANDNPTADGAPGDPTAPRSGLAHPWQSPALVSRFTGRTSTRACTRWRRTTPASQQPPGQDGDHEQPGYEEQRTQ